MAMATSDSQWHLNLSQASAAQAGRRGVYWLHPFQTYKTFCPYLVGSVDQVAEALRIYAAQGVTGLILDVPTTEEDLSGTAEAIAMASAQPVTL